MFVLDECRLRTRDRWTVRISCGFLNAIVMIIFIISILCICQLGLPTLTQWNLSNQELTIMRVVHQRQRKFIFPMALSNGRARHNFVKNSIRNDWHFAKGKMRLNSPQQLSFFVLFFQLIIYSWRLPLFLKGIQFVNQKLAIVFVTTIFLCYDFIDCRFVRWYSLIF